MAAIVRTDHVGSLVRPASLLDARDAYRAGRIDREALRQAEDAAILDALAMQREVGIAVFTDGEMRRDAYTTDLYDSVEGFEEAYPVREETRPDGTRVLIEYHSKAVRGKLRQARRLTAHESAFLKLHAQGPFKITMPTPISARATSQTELPQPYSSWDEVQQDLTAIFRGEMQALASEGVLYIQLDKVINSYANDASREQMRRQGIDPEKALDAEIAAENSCYDAVRGQGITLAMHLCRGNRTGWSGGSGGYDWPAASSRCDTCRGTRSSRWAWSAPRPLDWRARRTSCAGSTRRRSIARSSNWRWGRSAAFSRPQAATVPA